jgi:SAM-dependent methyltransferase
MSTPNIYAAILKMVRAEFKPEAAFTHLDIGAGEGELIATLKARFPNAKIQACDYHIERFPYQDVPIRRVDLNCDALPFDEASFDLVTCSEVVEHLENYHQLLRAAGRVLKPGGLLILTTPNVLNMQSRLRYLISGFPVLFRPIPLVSEEVYSGDSHITPITFFYLAHSLFRAGFGRLQLGLDKTQKTSLFLLALFWPFPFIFWVWFWLRELRKGHIGANRDLVLVHRRYRILVSRTLIVSARKKGAEPASDGLELF